MNWKPCKVRQNTDSLSDRFFRLMFKGKVESAIRLLGHKSSGRVLHLDEMIDDQAKSSKIF